MKNAKKRTPKIRIKAGDIVQVIAGDDASANKTGKVMQVMHGKQRAVVEGVNLVKKHIRKNQDYPQGGIIDKEAPIHVSNLRVVEKAGN